MSIPVAIFSKQTSVQHCATLDGVLMIMSLHTVYVCAYSGDPGSALFDHLTANLFLTPLKCGQSNKASISAGS